jgi:hypothetical protein
VALQPPPLTAMPLVELSLLLENMSHHQSEMEPRLETQCQTAVQEVIKFFLMISLTRILTLLLWTMTKKAYKLLSQLKMYSSKSRVP